MNVKQYVNNLWSALLGARSLENPAVPLTPTAALMQGTQSTAGLAVNEQRAIQLTAVYACVAIISETVASLSGNVYRVFKNGKRNLANDTPAYRLIFQSPNALMSPFTFRQTKTAHTLLWGNGYSLIDQTKGGDVLGMYPLMPWSMEPKVKNKKLRYVSYLPDGTKEELSPDEVLHIPGLSFDGVRGISPIQNMRNALGLAMAAEEFGARFFANDARPGLVLEIPGVMGPDQKAALKESVEAAHAGASRRWRVMVAEAGMKIHTVGVPPQDAQFLETRNFQVVEIARMFRTPLHLLQVTDKAATYASVEQFDIMFVKHTIRPWLVRWEQELNRKFFPDGDFVISFNVDDLLRGDFTSRTNGYRSSVGVPYMTVDEAREREGLQPIGGENAELARPLNFTGAEQPDDPNKKPAPAGGDKPKDDK